MAPARFLESLDDRIVSDDQRFDTILKCLVYDIIEIDYNAPAGSVKNVSLVPFFASDEQLPPRPLQELVSDPRAPSRWEACKGV